MSSDWVANFVKSAEIAPLLGVAAGGMSLRTACQDGIEAVKQLLVDVGIDRQLRNYGIPREATPSLVDKALRAGTCMLPSNPRVLTRADGVRVYEMAW